jgi:hypothetical protein
MFSASLVLAFGLVCSLVMLWIVRRKRSDLFVVSALFCGLAAVGGAFVLIGLARIWRGRGRSDRV